MHHRFFSSQFSLRRAHSEVSGTEDVLVANAPHVRLEEQSVPPLRIRSLTIVGAIALLMLLGRSAFLQISHSATYRDQAEGNRVRLLVDYAPRGVLFDQSGKQLVHNVPSTDVVVYPTQLPTDTEAVITALREVFPDMSASELQTLLSSIERTSARPVPLRSNISHEQLVALLARQDRLPGVSAENRAVRSYEGNGAFSHVLGYTGRVAVEEREEHPEYLLTESLGKTGIEKSYERILRGTHGARRVEVDARGTTQHELASIPSRPGMNLRLHIDAELQERLASALMDQASELGIHKASAVALDPRSGAVRALVSLPQYNHTALAQGITATAAHDLFSDPYQPLVNRTLQGTYPPGSTFKIAVAAGALEEDVIHASTTVESTGGIRIGQWFFPDWKAGGHGTTDIVKALAESVNTFFYIAGGGDGTSQGLGIDRMMKWAQRLGFGAPTGIDLPEEHSGFLPSPEWKKSVKNEPWYIGDTYHAAIGQGDISVTPLQLAVATEIIANGGTFYTPQIVDAFVRDDGSVIERLAPTIQRHSVLQTDTVATLQRGMRETVLSGSGRALRNLPVSISGKTGTAQTAASEHTHAWFTSFAPSEDPELVLTILLEEGGGGDRVAVPIARKIYAWYFSRGSGDAKGITPSPSP